MKFLLIIFLLWFTPSKAHAADFLSRSVQTICISNCAGVTDFSARKKKRHVRRHRVAPQMQEFHWPWGQVEQAAPRVRTAHNRKAYKQRYRHGYVTQQTSFGGGDLVSIARSQIGNGAIYGRARLWCARFMNYVVQRAGYRGTGSDAARSFAKFGTRVSGPQVGAIAVMRRRGGGHVGVVSGVDARGNPIVISGNHRKRVAESMYPAGRVIAYVVPN